MTLGRERDLSASLALAVCRQERGTRSVGLSLGEVIRPEWKALPVVEPGRKTEGALEANRMLTQRADEGRQT